MTAAGLAPIRSAVVVAVPAADPVVGPDRARLDPAAGWGVPAHVTVLHPFVPPALLDDEVLRRLADAVRTVPAFDVRLATARWFGDEVLHLHPEPDAPFRDLTAAVHAAFPDHPPYEGAFADVVPHLTVGQVGPGVTTADLRSAEARVVAGLPVGQAVEEAVLIAGTDAPASWQVLETFPLGPR